MRRGHLVYVLVFWLAGLPAFLKGQVKDPEAIAAMIAKFKKETRGPYLDIRWFCKDGTTRAARDPCPGISEGYQHARHRDDVNQLAKREHIFLGQILTSTPHEDFWDASHAQSRLKQYQLEQYLRLNDNGWIHRKSQFYRGAVQVEDENTWGIEFFTWLLEDASLVGSQFFLIRQSAKDIPHKADNNITQRVRSLSTDIADAYPAFQDLRIRIHGLPDDKLKVEVRAFQQQHQANIPAGLVPKFDQLIRGLDTLFLPFQAVEFVALRKRLPLNLKADGILLNFITNFNTLSSPRDKCRLISQTALQLREQITTPMKSTARLALIDVSNKLEVLLNKEIVDWQPATLEELLTKVYCLGEAATGFGFLELWEWEELKRGMAIPDGKSITLDELNEFSERGRNIAEWGTGMARSQYNSVINVYREFEPMANGFLDDRIRSSILLHVGLTVSKLGDEFAREANFSNNVLAIDGQSAIRGLNPGYATGQLIIVDGSPDDIKLSPDKIYVFLQAPDDLKPVAGILTVSEGNMVSHVQLLARNLGIPNAVLSKENMEAIKAFHMLDIFYAVSNRGTVIIKPWFTMAPWEFALFAQKKRSEEKISVPIDRIILNDPRIVNLNHVDATQSGKLCGPKAANLGQLKKMFPENVVEGLVVPFSIFRQHMEQTIPGREKTYWAVMKGIFEEGDRMRIQGVSEVEIEKKMLAGLETLRGLIKKMPLLASFRQELNAQFLAAFGKSPGEIPVFIRSDTNMEDLKDFTGAGLNLTVFNVVETEKILQGIRDVWASPYTERSFKWRQRYLNNPENVYPSIVIIPSVNADHSGVVITKGITTRREEDITVAFNRGVGGAVDGQAAETWVINSSDPDYLISPARELFYQSIPSSGGSVKVQTNFMTRIVRPEHLDALKTLTARIRKELPNAPGINTTGPFDMELGFKDNKIWLFQVRPFVENKKAAASKYLEFITPDFKEKEKVKLGMTI